jgi:hypothetical protein
METWEENREVFARFGLAAYNAQSLEYELISLLLLFQRTNMATIDLEALFSTEQLLSKRTLGQLINQLRTKISFDSSYEEMLITALEKRNYLMHRFFHHHAYNLPLKSGRDMMVEELDEISYILDDCDNMMQIVTAMFAKVCGITDETIQAVLEQHGIVEIER